MSINKGVHLQDAPYQLLEYTKMIRQQIHIKNEKYDWKVRIYYIVTDINAEEIMEQLIALGCSGENLQDAELNLTKGQMNTGLTYSNVEKKKTVMVIAKTSTAMEFACSQQHEVGHLKSHMAEAYGIPQKGEEIQYLGDEIYRKMWPEAKMLLCDCCRHKEEDNE